MQLISVVVPVYNTENQLKKCVDSILEQSFRDYELILVDDGSTDSSGLICDQYSEKDKRIKVIHKKNGGLSDARNAGIEASKGEYISFIDSDDWVAPQYLDKLYTNLIKYSADISIVNFHKQYDDRRDKAPEIISAVMDPMDALNLIYDPNYSIYINIACNKLYRRELFEEIRFPFGRLHEDGFTLYKLLIKAKKIYFDNSDLYFYYQRSGSIMNSKFSVKKTDEIFVYLERKKFFKENNMETLYRQNESSLLRACKSIALKLYKSKYPLREKKKWFGFIKESVSSCTLTTSRFDSILRKSPAAWCMLYSAKEKLSFVHKNVNDLKIWATLIARTLWAKARYGKKIAFFMLTPLGGNLGDQALCFTAERMWDEIHFIEMPCSHFGIYMNHVTLLKRLIKNTDIVFNAGGYIGTIWFEQAEVYARKIIAEFKDNKIIMLPNTVYFDDTEWGKQELINSQTIYNSHPNLIIYCRERESYAFAKRYFNDVRLAPDLVFSLPLELPNYNRKGALLCLRRDCEKTLRDSELNAIVKIVNDRFETKSTDTVVPYRIAATKRKKELLNKLKEISSAEVVITDRLHGMIFCAITHTPCVVVLSKSHKVQGCYEWVKNLEYIRIAESVQGVAKLIDVVIKADKDTPIQEIQQLHENLHDDVIRSLSIQ